MQLLVNSVRCGDFRRVGGKRWTSRIGDEVAYCLKGKKLLCYRDNRSVSAVVSGLMSSGKDKTLRPSHKAGCRTYERKKKVGVLDQRHC